MYDEYHFRVMQLSPCSLLAESERERERGREFTPFQPHRADAGAARTSPGRSYGDLLLGFRD